MNIPSRTFSSSPAVRSNVPLLVGIMSPSGGGKTYSALRLATGIQQISGGEIFGVDTENNRMLHYADQFKFQHVPFSAPFGSLDYLAALRHCNAKGSRITIVDSMSLEHIGDGGYLETAEAVVNRIAGNDYKKREAVKMLGWATAGPLRQKMIEGIKQLDGAFIFCFRAKEKTKPVRNNKEGKTDIIDMGFMPIAGEEWVYEMALNCMLEPRSGGVPTWRSDHIGERLMMKLPKQFEGIFAEPKPLDEDIGRALAEWARGDTPSVTRRPAPATQGTFINAEQSKDYTEQSKLVLSDEPTIDELSAYDLKLTEAAEQGVAELQKVWKTLPKGAKESLKAALDRRHKPRAQEVGGAEVA